MLRWLWRKVTLADWMERQRDKPMSCHCWTTTEAFDRYGRPIGARIDPLPTEHEPWCPAGKTPRELGW